MKIFIGADHRGFALKNILYKQLVARGHEVTDCGPHKLDPADDYPDYAQKVAEGVAKNPDSRGILLCGSGVGMDVVANKVRGVRATVGYKSDEVVHGRARDDINVLALPADSLAPEQAEALVELFLITPFGGAERDLRRQKEIADLEAQNFK
ncbi:MAG: RpiB/LacA/LacB family sugar-phosphate isomerase [Patescibacteria group bacterium]